MAFFTIGKLAKASGVAVDTVRYYESEGLLPPPQRSPAGYRLYADDTLRRLRFIRRAKDLGFNLREIASLLQLSEQAGSSAQVKQLTAQKLRLVESKIHALEQMHAALQALEQHCDGQVEIRDCPIIAALNGDAEP